MTSGSRGGPRAFWEREQVSALGSVVPVRPASAPSAQHPPAHSPYPPEAYRPTDPPARVGGAVAALAVALLTLAIPILGVYLGLWFFALVANLPGIGFGIATLVKIPDAREVERFIRYTWACNFIYIALPVVLMIPLLLMAAFIFTL